ncbi:MAG: GNAT family N-acetyltransferase [Verrucomicrobia bacterium]|nr:GNAT family N-acetyltransferase [Verrucomicrobiota bacterium]MCG2679213.1 GNAT family N-acetyltransferase [Kiritimatiellia bacterium]MBU4248606.1 GNAT family N-acetyltransferase [Verrucomicrobiota bacterium]MBU4290068.1 GNAT family N-acetyltransferase [Verrucomicrobiota bacterium]MBU4430344.1 GNAT family N-acetyltransferase [Verrucomicrobiota bacterium]
MKQLLNTQADPNIITDITLGKDAAVDLLYGCFRINNPRGDAFATQRDVEIVARSGNKIRINVPETMKIDLPADTKLANTQMFRLENIGKYRDTMYLLTLRAGWNQVERDINRMIDLDPEGTFVGKLYGKEFDILLATASVLPLGRNNSWIGMILVHPEVRRQGIANAMMQACVKYAIDSGKIINGLDATPMGNTVYGAVGYVNSYRIWRSVFQPGEFAEQTYDTHHVTAIKDNDLSDVIRYDADAFLERNAILRGLFTDSQDGCFVYRNDHGAVQGYCFTRPGRLRPFVGPFVADTEAIARALLIAASRHLHAGNPGGTALIDTPESKFSDPGIYVERVFEQKKKPSGHRLSTTLTPVRDFTRMYQLVRDTDVDKLVEQLVTAEGLDKQSPRVHEFRETMAKSVNNYTITRGFMELERQELQKKFWGITGPEKG